MTPNDGGFSLPAMPHEVPYHSATTINFVHLMRQLQADEMTSPVEQLLKRLIAEDKITQEATLY